MKKLNDKYMNIIKSYFSKFKKKIKRKIKKSLKNVAKRYSKEAMELDIPIASYYYILYKIASKLNYHYKASDMMLRVIKLQPKAKHYFTLSKPLIKSNQWWRVVDALSKAIELHKEAPVIWRSEYANALEKMNRFKDAAKEWEKILELDNNNAQAYFRYGVTLQKLEKTDQANTAFSKAIALDKENNSKSLGIGIFYEKLELWVDANKAYLQELTKQPNNALLYFKTGFSFDRLYDWKDAEKYFLKALDLDPTKNEWWYRLGFVLERQKKWSEATKSYRKAIVDSHIFKEYWIYRLGFVSNKEESYKESCDAFLKMNTFQLSLTDKFDDVKEKIIALIVNEKSDSDEYAIEIDNITSWDALEKFIKYIVERKEDFLPELYYSLGYVLTQTKKYPEASNAFIKRRILQEAHGVDEKPYWTDPDLMKVINYTEYYERYSLDEKSILYESYHGVSISCNPYAIFKSLVEDIRFKEYKHIWIINDKRKIPDTLKSHNNIIFVKRDSDLYMYYLAKTKYLINNSTFPACFIRKEDQVYLNTWHGTPIKYMGKDIKNDFMSHKNVTKNFLQTTHMIQPNEHTTDILLTRHDVDGIYCGVVAETGYPRQDLMLNISKKEKDALYEKLNISRMKKTVLYAPTWRGVFSEANFSTSRLKDDIRKIQEVEGVNLLFRGHYTVEQGFNKLDSNITIVPSDIDTNTLLSVVDILITDYSSISFDFMAMERPIIYYVYDKEEYEGERGLYFPTEELGGDICMNGDELKQSLSQILLDGNISKKQKTAQNKFCPFDDGHATKRVIDLVFFDKQDNIKLVKDTKKKSVLLYGGDFNPNGINTSFLNLLNHIDKSVYDIAIVIDPDTINRDEKRLEQFIRLNSDIKVIARINKMTITLEELWIKNQFDSQRFLAAKEMWSLYESMFNREYKRMFGTTHFDAVVDFNGYGIFWPSLFAFQSNSTIYLHNDMYGEWKLRFPTLENIFNLYRSYTTLASVSAQTMEHNINNLTDLFRLDKKKFIFCDNIQNPEDALSRADELLENKNDETIFRNTKVFINIARLSPEKDQEKLIRAFANVLKKYPEPRLINLGIGPLKHHLEGIINELKLEGKVFLLGQRLNPYPYLQKSDCFILSSNHEGQPMTLFEAMILEKPIIATDIVGNRSVLEGRPGHLIENSENGLYQGMIDFLDGKYKNNETFDCTEYNQNALNMFYAKVIK